MFHVKHQVDEVAHLITLAATAGVSIDTEQAIALLGHLDWLIETNNTHNLTAIRDRNAGVRLHIVDSLLSLPEVASAPPGEMLDIGTGGGFPGVPLSIVSGRRVTLLDSVAKKVRLVSEYVHAAGLAADIAPVRAEDWAREHMGRYSIVLARAVSQLPSVVELAAPLLASSGRLIALKGAISAEELERGKRAANRCGMKVVSDRRTYLPEGGEERAIIAFEKIGTPTVRLPRRVGLAQKSPLA